ncbi:MAG: cation-translocating P-type ATPase, partial [Pirellulales bacterium]|nr:cation-translocating P-type ATPase [Pirellulales bacterium]
MCDCQPISDIFRVPSLHCQEELTIIRKALDGLAGIADVTADYMTNSVRVEYCPHRLDAVAICGAINNAGFDVIPPSEIRPGGPCGEEICSCKISAERESARPRWRVTTTVGGMLLLLGIVIWTIHTETNAAVAAVLVASAVACGIPVARAALRSIRHLKFDMNVLMSIAAIGAFGIGDYFEAATAMFLFSVSLWLEALSMDRARRAVQSLVELAPTVAHRLRTSPEKDATGCLSASAVMEHPETLADKQPVAPNDTLDAIEVEDIDPIELAVGDVVLLRPGEMVPIDGTVIHGISSLNQATITGESIPVEKETGDEVFAGTLNGEGALWIRATRTAESSTLSRIAHMVSQAQAARSPTERFVERFAARYTPLVIVLAILL